MTIQLKRNDTKDVIGYTMTNADGTPVNLTGATVRFIMGKGNTLITNAAATIVNAAAGTVEYTLTETDTLAAGVFQAEFEVTFSNGKVKTFPNNGYIKLHIQSNIDSNQSTYIEDQIAYRVSDIQILKNSIQAQLNQFAVGATNAETSQARVEADGTTNATLKARLDKKETKFANDIASLTTSVAQNMKKTFVSVTDYGAKGDGVTDDTIAIQNAINTGKYVFFPSGTYLLNGSIASANLYLFGSGYEEVEIITSAPTVFTNATKGTIKGLKFKSNTPLTGTLFTNSVSNFSSHVKNCYFQDYEYAFYFPTYGNGVRLEECYFRHGKVGLHLNLAHATSIINCRFWQQSQNSFIIERATGGYVKGCDFVGTQGRPATAKFYSSSFSFEDNYMEGYPSTGASNEAFVLVDYNKDSNMPSFYDNLINCKAIYTNGIKFTNIAPTQTEMNNSFFALQKNIILDVATPISITLNKFSKIRSIGNSGLSTFQEKRYYSSIVDYYTPAIGTVVVPIDGGIVNDAFGLANGDNTIKAHATGIRYMVEVKGSIVTSVANSGVDIKLRDVNGTTLKTFRVVTPNIGETPFNCYIVDTSESNSSYRVDTTSISGTTLPDSVKFFVELKEL
ncbi:glycosyl hydrolase family 28-related protein [Neobacillus sp. DY30]|uniref:glycosyl hydrolase family 28-related protein n=1 Tax=Neobacillus sp. DY30 TaxID=3047871 RepID=UPI0024BF9AE3|nr:glycosyl hydrolase family 28-related protein [Neobacillus sp. DY30]WHY01880.1 glycosyl hydrolase family 28-related protein [Neobacillus sp. DY30]